MDSLPLEMIDAILFYLNAVDEVHAYQVFTLWKKIMDGWILINDAKYAFMRCHDRCYLSITKLSRSRGTNWNLYLAGACMAMDKKILEIAITQGATDFNIGLQGACHVGSIEFARDMISRGANAFNLSLGDACEYGNIECIDLMKEHGANNWNLGLVKACLGGHVSIVHDMIRRGANMVNDGLKMACMGGHLELVKLLKSLGASNFTDLLFQACSGNNKQVVDFVIENCDQNWNAGLSGSCKAGDVEMVRNMIARGADDFDCALFYACASRNHATRRLIIDLLIEHGASNWDYGLDGACVRGSMSLVKLMLAAGAKNIDDAYETAYKHGHYKICDKLNEVGCTKQYPTDMRNISFAHT